MAMRAVFILNFTEEDHCTDERKLCRERTQFPMLETYSGQNIVLGYNDLDRSKFSKLEYLGPWRALEVVVFFKKWIPEE